MKTGILLLLVAGLVVGCATERKKLTAGGQKVEVMVGKPRKGCDVVDKVVGENDIGSVPLATNHARNLAAEAGGNGIVVNREVENGKEIRVYATAYICQ